ncbi:allantoate amidohydrolase [Nesterenkonia aurantiaca]|uniref:N-carbamoyl-L-amino-acid hydrolase n=1 Tax=Nesterenkonia aurantiaca TaxID=1436010 RepID=A0A4R7G825_9MICC|nr:allantoate amidohydrolase [Nesterenkonia aurantiaca]TDS87772.1 N-carbamoyl-L-amino-acid hydrolase [Nesterenkonia aurantiaca]
MTAVQMLAAISEIGRDQQRGGYSRPVFSEAELELRAWFTREAASRGLDVEVDRNGALWAWLDAPHGKRQDVVITGSHLDSVPGGGAYDGPLGVVSGVDALARIKERGHPQRRALAVVVFPEEEGSRYNQACLGSRLMVGELDPQKARALTDAEGVTFAELAARHGLDPEHLGADPERMQSIAAFVELHVEQGKGLVHMNAPVAVATSILGHGRWHLRLEGEGNHAGTTPMDDRRDPMVAAAQIILAVREEAAKIPDARATIGNLIPVPGGTNVIASAVDLWMDVRHLDDAVVRRLVRAIEARTQAIAAGEGCSAVMSENSYSPTVTFDRQLQQRMQELLPGAPLLPTGAGHDAGVLSAYVPSAMLFVRNPGGVSHAPAEHAGDADIEEGVLALVTVLEDLSR